MRSTKLGEKSSTIGFLEEYSRATLNRVSCIGGFVEKTVHFAYLLQDCDNHLEVANMEGRQRQSNMPEMPIALLKSQSTGLTDARLG